METTELFNTAAQMRENIGYALVAVLVVVATGTLAFLAGDRRW